MGNLCRTRSVEWGSGTWEGCHVRLLVDGLVSFDREGVVGWMGSSWRHVRGADNNGLSNDDGAGCYDSESLLGPSRTSFLSFNSLLGTPRPLYVIVQSAHDHRTSGVYPNIARG